MTAPDVLRQALKQVIDPELGINIVDIGLIYRLDVQDQRVELDLTMTSPACPMGDVIIEDAENALRALLPSSTEVDITLVWEPPWSPELMSADARRWLGWDEE
jgi:metal-sulfur cluster biosynthetic enzyme